MGLCHFFEQHAEQDLYGFIIQFDRGFYIHCSHIRLWTMHVKALVQFDDMIIQPNTNSYPNLYPNRIVMVQDSRHKKDDCTYGEYHHNSRARVHESTWMESEKKRAL
jgi:hypothetical protein